MFIIVWCILWATVWLNHLNTSTGNFILLNYMDFSPTLQGTLLQRSTLKASLGKQSYRNHLEIVRNGPRINRSEWTDYPAFCSLKILVTTSILVVLIPARWADSNWRKRRGCFLTYQPSGTRLHGPVSTPDVNEAFELSLLLWNLICQYLKCKSLRKIQKIS